MRDVTIWSVGLGRWLGVPVRLHVSFVLLALGVMFISTRSTTDPEMWIKGLLLLSLWLLSALLHEAGHAAAVSRLGGSLDDVVLTPFGELAGESYLLDPQRELYAALSGPLVSLCAGFCCAAMLYALGEPGLGGLLNPFYPRDLTVGSWPILVLKMGMWVNWLLVVINILPAFPLDGGRVLKAALGTSLGSRRATLAAVRATLVVSVTLVVLAVLLGGTPTGVVVPAWLPLLTLATYIYFHARLEWDDSGDDDGEEALFGYDFSQGYTSLEPRSEPVPAPRPGFLRRWLERRRIKRDVRRRVVELEEEQRVDAILQRLHEEGPQSLSSEDQALLNRVSARYRARTESESS